MCSAKVKEVLMTCCLKYKWGYSSGVEHLTADQEVPGSNPGAPLLKYDFGS